MMFRPEYPKPQFERADWMNLNGQWDFEIDEQEEREFTQLPAKLAGVIHVPFCCESALSGIGRREFIYSVWYRRNVTLDAGQLQGRVVLHFGAVDYCATVYVNGKSCGSHKGGYVSFCFDITDYVFEGENQITVHAQDDTRSPWIPTGKQSMELESKLCHYTRTTGIWQTVWLEFTPKTYIKSVKYYPDAEDGTLTVRAKLQGEGTFRLESFFEGKPMGAASCKALNGEAELTVNLEEIHLWEPGKGGLYDLILRFEADCVKSYFGLRSIAYTDHKFLLNGKSVFQRLVLDQGFYPDGIYTAPTEEALVRDIDLAMAMGFNGARLHEKIFEERFLYHCDRKGYLVWGEYPDWGLDLSDMRAMDCMLPEWLASVERDFNHPAIVGWCPLNEVWDRDGKSPDRELIRRVYEATKAADPTRPCIDASGGFHGKTDIYDLHDYEQDPEKFRSYYEKFDETLTVSTPSAFSHRQNYEKDVPFFLSEYGGASWDAVDGWGYGDAPKTREEFLERLERLTNVLMDSKKMFGFCYTQLYDVEQEKNGLYTYERIPKFPADRIYPIFARPAAIENEV